MIRSTRVLVFLCSVPLLLLGVKSMFFPESTYELFEVTPTGTYGFNTIRASLGGLFLTGASLMLAGLWTKDRTWFHAALLMVTIVFAGRIFSLCTDGWTTVATPALVIEVLIIGVLVFASKDNDSSRN
jgi:hypothetical protein